MGDGGKGSGEDVGTSKGPIDDVQGIHPGSAPLWEKNLVGHGRNDEGTGRFSPSDFQRDYGDNGAESRQKGMKVGLGVSGVVGDNYIADGRVLTEAGGRQPFWSMLWIGLSMIFVKGRRRCRDQAGS